MDQRRGQRPFGYAQVPTRHQTRYSEYVPPDDRLYTQNYREFRDTSHGLYPPSYYQDDYRDSEFSEIYSETTRPRGYTTADRNIPQHQSFEYTGQDNVRYSHRTVGNTGDVRYRHHSDGHTPHDRYLQHTAESTSFDRYEPRTVGNTGQQRYQPHTPEKTANSRYPPHNTGQHRDTVPTSHAGNISQNRYPGNSDRNTGQRNAPHTPGNTGHSRYDPHSPGNAGQSRYSTRTPENEGNNRYHKVQNTPLSHTRTGSYRPIPVVYGQGNDRTPKKWNSPKGSRSSANKMINRISFKPQQKQNSTQILKSSMSKKTRSDPVKAAASQLPKTDKTNEEVSVKSPNINKQIDFNNQASCKKTEEISQSNLPDNIASQKGILSAKDNDLNTQENSMTETVLNGKLPMQTSAKGNTVLATKNPEEKINEPQIVIEIELTDKLENIDLDKGVKENNKQENIKMIQTNVDTVNIKEKDPVEIGKDEKTKKGDITVNSEPSAKDSINSGAERETLNSEIDCGRLSLTDKESVKNEIKDKDKNLKYSRLTGENKDIGENSKLCDQTEQDDAFVRKESISDSNEGVQNSVKQSEPELSKVGSDMRTIAKDNVEGELKEKEDLENRNIDLGHKKKPCDWKKKKINAFHKRVLSKLAVKTSLVREVNNQSLELLLRKKDPNTSGSSVELCITDESMELDQSINITTDTDTEFDLESGSDIESTSAKNTEDDLTYDSKNDQECPTVGGENEICLKGSNKEKNRGMLNVLRNTKQVVDDKNKELISEYSECEGSNKVKGSDFGIMDVDSNVSMHFVENIELNDSIVDNKGTVFKVKCSDTNNTLDTKLIQVFGDSSVDFDDVDFEGLNTKKGIAVVRLLPDNTNNIENAIELKNGNIFDASDAKHTANDNSNVGVSEENVVELGITHISTRADESFKKIEQNVIVDTNVTVVNKDTDVVYDAETVDVECGTDKVASFRETHALDSPAAVLKQKYNNKVPHESNLSVETSSEDTEADIVDNKEDKADKLQGETKDNPEDLSELDNDDDSQHHTPMDTQSVETKSVSADHTFLKKIDSQEQNYESPNVGWRNTLPLSERFSQLTNRSVETVDYSEETKFKREFENIVNRLNKHEQNCGPNTQTTSESEQNEEMDVDKPLDGSDDVKDSEMLVEESGEQVKNKDSEEVNKQSDSMSNEGVKEKTEVRKNVEHNSTSPVSFLDYSDDSDDELLVTPSAFLRSIEEINGRPLVITPTKVTDSSQNSSTTTSSNDLSPLKPVPQKPGLKNKFTLDGLLADHEERADVVKEMNEIDQQLQDEIKQGGFVNILNKEDAAVAESPITDEQKEILRQFEVEESRICEDRPGVVVFEPQNYQCLFTSLLHPTDCGFTVGSNGLSLEKHLESLTPAQCKRVITCGIISQCFTKISCQTPIMRWLFFIMSVHDDYQVQQGCKKVLLEILHFQLMDGQQKWAPRLVDILSVLSNYGASLESLIPCNSSTLEIIRGKLVHQPGHAHQAVAGNVGMNSENLILVLQILAQCLHGPSGRYSPNDLSLLCVALCKASLDTSLKHLCAKSAFQNCITMVIRQYLEADWIKERLKLTRMLVGITDHHHNNAHIAELLPPGTRGQFIQRGFCYLVLGEILLGKTNVSDELLKSIQIRDLGKFIPKLKDLLESDSYKLSSVVTLIDLCVGVHITLNSEEREQLKCLLEDVRRVRVRDNVSMLDRTRVKDMIVRMTSKWALDIQTMKGKQTKIFEYASPVKMHIEQVTVLESSGDEDDQSDNENDRPCKLQKLSSQIST